MFSPKEVRQQLGLTISEFASLLNTGNGHVSMAECGLRSLPIKSLEIAGALYKALAATETEREKPQKLSDETMSLLTTEIHQKSVRLETLKIEEPKLVQKLKAARCMAAMPGDFTEWLAKADADYMNLPLTLMKRKAADKIEKGERQLILMQLEIAGLEAEIERAEILKKEVM